MIVYLETNFLFELGMGRAQQDSCRTLVEWCRAARIEIRIPAFAIPEARGALRRREGARLDVIRGLKTQENDARRHSADPAAYELAQSGLREWTRHEGKQVEALTQELFALAKFVSLDFEALEHASRLREAKVVSGEADLFIVASIIRDLEVRASSNDRARSLFVTGDTDFAKAKRHLRPYSCDLLTSYSAAVARLKGSSP